MLTVATVAYPAIRNTLVKWRDESIRTFSVKPLSCYSGRDISTPHRCRWNVIASSAGETASTHRIRGKALVTRGPIASTGSQLRLSTNGDYQQSHPFYTVIKAIIAVEECSSDSSGPNKIQTSQHQDHQLCRQPQSRNININNNNNNITRDNHSGNHSGKH